MNTKISILTKVPDEAGILDIKYGDISTFTLLPDNIKAHNKPGIKASIREYGFVEPIGINRRTGNDIFGNGRLECLREMLADDEDCPKGIVEKIEYPKTLINLEKDTPKRIKWFAPFVDGLDFDEAEEVILAARLNRENELGGINYQKAFEILKRLRENSPEGFERTGFDAASLEHIQMLAKFRDQVAEMKDEAENKSNDPDEEPESTENICIELNRKWNVAPGDVWQIGKHRLICGDSRKPETYEKLLVGAKIRLVFSSPPYDNARNYELTEKLDWTGMMNDVSKNLFDILSAPADIVFNLGIIYKDSEAKFYWNDWLDYCKNELKNPLYGFYVWDKITGMAGEHKGRLASAHEFFFHFSIGKASANKWIEKTNASIRRGPKKTNYRMKDGGFKGLSSPDSLEQPFKVPDSVIRLQKEVARGIHTQGHPATFPVALPSFLIKTYTLIGDSVLEPFCGSGTTMVAAQELDRQCFGIELSENYCALILERMSLEFSDLKCTKIC